LQLLNLTEGRKAPVKAPLHIAQGRVVPLAAAALAGGLISVGGYALAASGSTTIHACADTHTGILHVQKKCHRGQRRITWNQRGPQGLQGAAGTSPVTAWTVVGDTGSTFGGHGITVQHVSAGTYRVTATPPQCAQGIGAPVVSVSDANPPNGQTAGAFPVVWVGDAGGPTFTVTTGVVVSGSFTASDRQFNVQVPCT
jgi:hypothetical protein